MFLYYSDILKLVHTYAIYYIENFERLDVIKIQEVN